MVGIFQCGDNNGGSCASSSIYTNTNHVKNINLTCLGDDGCGDVNNVMSIYCSDTHFPSSLYQYGSSYRCTDYECCPFVYNRNIALCPENNPHCIINCTWPASTDDTCDFGSMEHVNIFILI